MFTIDGMLDMIRAIGTDPLLSVVRAIIILILGFILARITGAAIVRLLKESATPHRAMLVRRGSFYIIITIFAISALLELGFDLSVLLGTAGILTVAIGFASQTSMSNLISGLFLIGERPFEVNDVIQVENITGEVLSIDLLSVKLRTFDNTYVRIPNESIIKTPVITLTRFPIRRIDMQIGVAYEEDMDRVRTLLFEIAEKNVLCLEEPKPLLIVQGFGESNLNVQFSVWVVREKFLELKNSIQMEIKQAFKEAGIVIPFPHRTLNAGSITDSFPVHIVAKPETQEKDPLSE